MAPAQRTAVKTEKIRRIDSYFPRLKTDKPPKSLPINYSLRTTYLSSQMTVYSKLDREDLQELKCVSKKMNLIASHESLKKIKYQPEFGSISQIGLKRDCTGYSVIFYFGLPVRTFTLKMKSNGRKSTIRAQKPGSRVTKKSRRKREACTTKAKTCGGKVEGSGRIQMTSKDYYSYMDEYVGCPKPFNTCTDCRAPQSVPLAFYDLVKTFTDDYSFRTLMLSNITIDEEFLDRLTALMAGSKLNYGLNFCNTPIDKNLPFEKLSKLIASLNPSRALISSYNFPMHCFDEQFIINHPSSELNLEYIRSLSKQIHRFSPTVDFVPILSRFDELTYPGLILEPTVILGALKINSQTSKHWMQWNISTNCSEVDLSIFDTEEYEIQSNTSDEHGYRHVIMKKNDDLHGEYHIVIDNYDDHYHPFKADIRYYNNTIDF